MVDPDKPKLPFLTLDEHLPLYQVLVSFDELFNPIARDIRAMPAPIGEAETGEVIAIGDAERCGGLYILGKPRTGKSTLLISLALSDIKKGHSIIFIDPHTDAINELLLRIPENRVSDVMVLDLTDKPFAFGIDLLRCKDLADPLELDRTCARVRDIFAKVWGDDNGRLGLWLEKILRSCHFVTRC